MKIRIYSLLWVLVFIVFISACRKDKGQEGTVVKSVSLTTPASWSLSSTPQLFPESGLMNDTRYGMNRARISWYETDVSVFYVPGGGFRPQNITKDDMSKDDCRVICQSELFPDLEPATNQPLNLASLNVDYYPVERGPWNFSVLADEYTAGISNDGSLNLPESRWGGIVRVIPETGLVMNYLDFWLLAPFSCFPDAQGDLYLDIGEISEDMLKDGRLSAEHTQEGAMEQTAWGYVKPLTQNMNFSTDNYLQQDVGLDEMNSQAESAYFHDFLSLVQQHCNSEYYQSVLLDATGDDYHYFLGEDYDALDYKVRDRYKLYNGMENNSFRADQRISSRTPSSEDINRNGLLDTKDNYSEFKIRISPDAMVTGQNYLVKVYQESAPDIHLENGKKPNSTFYHFRIPLRTAVPENGVAFSGVNPLYLRLFLTGFHSEINLRFLTLTLSELPED